MTSSFVFLSVNDTFNILLMNHISTASKRRIVSAVKVQHSHPYRRIDHTYVFRVLILVHMRMSLFVNMLLILLKVNFDIPILFFFSYSLLPSGVMVQPRYLKVSTCLICSPLQVILHFDMTGFFDTTIHSFSLH